MESRTLQSTALKWFGKVRPDRASTLMISQDDPIEKSVVDILHATPHGGAARSSVRSMAKRSRLSTSTVQQVWAARGIVAHLVKTFELSIHKAFEEKLRDVVELYLNRPDESVVLSVDEKSQAQALNRSPAEPADEARRGRHDGSRLQARRRDDAVRRPLRLHRRALVPSACPFTGTASS